MDTPSSASAHRNRYAVLAAVASAMIVVVVSVAQLTQRRIVANDRAWFVARLDALLPAARHDNDLLADAIQVSAPDLLGDARTTIYRSRLGQAPTGAILHATATDGYGGAIELLIAIDYQGTLLGVDVLRHVETQGIGDGFAPHRSSWLRDLGGRSLNNPEPSRWTIRKDGGDFDQFTGASVTPRAILKAVRRALEYYATHRQEIFDAPASGA